jgi:hypothetical protein
MSPSLRNSEPFQRQCRTDVDDFVPQEVDEWCGWRRRNQSSAVHPTVTNDVESVVMAGLIRLAVVANHSPTRATTGKTVVAMSQGDTHASIEIASG